MSAVAMTLREVRTPKGAIVICLVVIIGFFIYYSFLSPRDIPHGLRVIESTVFVSMLLIVAFVSRLVANSKYFAKMR